MNVRNCRRCGNLFNYALGPMICPKCREAMDAKFKEVKEYVRDNPGVGIKEVSEACEVETQQIQQWLREERLQFSEDSVVQLACESCGAMIRSGRFCDKCKAEVTNGFKQVINSARPKPEDLQIKKTSHDNKMRFI